jgi:hypothetical protein
MGGFEKKVGGRSLVHETFGVSSPGPIGGPGKRTIVEQVAPTPVQRAASADGKTRFDDADGAAVQQAAAVGVAGGGRPLPHGDLVQRLFGRHDISGIEAHIGGAAETASRSIGAEAYATGNHVAFAGSPSLHTAAHEAAHVVQQRGGVQLKGGVGEAGDTYERHADQVADAVVAGRSAEGLLDVYARGGGQGGSTVQRQAAPTPATQPTDPTAQPAVAAKPDPAAIATAIKKLDAVAALTFADVKDNTLAVEPVTTWMSGLAQALTDAKTAAVGNPPDLLQAIDRCLTAHANEIKTVADKIKTATIQLTNDSSVAEAAPKAVTFPTQDDVHALSHASTLCGSLARDSQMPGNAATKATLQAGTDAMQDATLATLQSRSVVTARERWKKGKSTESPDAAHAGKGARTELDEIFKDAGWSDRVNADENSRIYDWCGMFVASSYFKGAGLASQLRAGFYHVNNVKDFFQYEQAHNPDRSPSSIWADGQWSGLREYHQARGSSRQWTTRATIQAALKGGQSPDIRSGDTCLIDHGGGNNPVHIVMVESYDATTKILVTIEGNTYGVVADGDRAEHVDDDHLKDSARGNGTAAGIHERDMSTLAPGPTTYTVSEPNAYIREDSDLTKFRMDGPKKAVLAVGASVVVTEVKNVAGGRYGHLQDGGWTKVSNLTSTVAALPKGAAKPNSGATVFGVGRPSVVDFEDGHGYAIHAVPAELQHTSPDDIKAMAKKKDKAGGQAKAVGVK